MVFSKDVFSTTKGCMKFVYEPQEQATRNIGAYEF